MSDPAATPAPSAPAAATTPGASAPGTGERRQDADRRANASATTRRGRRPVSRRMLLAKQLGFYGFAVAMLVSTILFAVQRTRPIYARKATLSARIAQRADSIQQVNAEKLTKDSTLVAATGPLRFRDPRTEDERRRFAADLVATGRMKPERADSVAFYAVREAYSRNLPPALILGVMLTENTVFVSKARSNVGAVGLMQIYPKVWLRALGKKLGTDLENDETNLRYGSFILAEYLKPKKGQTQTAEGVRRGLLKYNGCVRGTNTPRCFTYPDKIERYVRSDAKSLCRGKGFHECITVPFVQGLTGDTTAAAMD